MSGRYARGAALDRLAARTARRLLAWSAARLSGNERAWLRALAGELDEIEGGRAQLAWALGGLRLVWLGERRRLVSRAYRFGPVALILLAGTLLGGLAFLLAQRYAALALGLGVLTGVGMLVAMPVLFLLVWVAVRLVRWWVAARGLDEERTRRLRSRLAVVAGALGLVALLGLGLSLYASVDQMLIQGPATAGIVAGPVDQSAVAAALHQVPGMARPDVYLTTLVRPVAVNGVPLAQLPLQPSFCPPKYPGPTCPAPTGQQLAQVIQGIADKFTSIQGFDLAHGQLPRITQFASGAGATGPGPNQMVGPWGRQLDGGDADTYNVMVSANQVPFCPPEDYRPGPPQHFCADYQNDNDDVVSVQSLVTGQIVNLRIVGQFWLEDGQSTPLFGKVLADEGVVQALSGGAPSYAYGLRVDAGQRQALFARVSAAAPAARLYDFTSIASGARTAPGYTSFTDAADEEGYFAVEHAGLTLQAAVSAALLAAVVVASWQVWALARARRRAARAALGI
jgi:hypothetical protein